MEIQVCQRGYVVLSRNREEMAGRLIWPEMMAFSTKRELIRYLDNNLPTTEGDAPDVEITFNPGPMVNFPDPIPTPRFEADINDAYNQFRPIPSDSEF